MLSKKEVSEFEAARKKRRKKFARERTRKITAIILILAILSLGIYFFIKEDIAGIIGDRLAANAAGSGTFPVDMSGVTVLDTFSVGEHTGVLTDAVYLLYTNNGKQLLSAQHGFANPIVESAGRRFLIYDQGGNKLVVRTRDKILFEKEFEYKIVSANLSDDGMLSVVTSAQRYASKLYVFDDSYSEEIFTWSSSDEYIVASSADKKGKTVAAAAISANGSGEMVTTVHIFTTEAALELGSREFKGSSVLSLEHDEKGDVKIICDNIAACVDINGNILGSCMYDSIPASSVNVNGKNGAAIVFDRFTEARAADIVFLDDEMSEIKTVSVAGKYVCCDGNGINTAVYASGKAYIFDSSGNTTATFTEEQDAVLVEITGDKLFAVTRNEFCEVK